MARIVALLFSFANLAEDAAGRSLVVRWRVMWILWTAHDVARDFIAGCAPGGRTACWSPALPEACRGHDPSDAMALAHALRALALMLGTLAAQVHGLARLRVGLGGGEGSAMGQLAANLSRLLSDRTVTAVERLDTS